MLLLGIYDGDDDDVDDGGSSFGSHGLLTHQCPVYHSHVVIFNTSHNFVGKKTASLYILNTKIYQNHNFHLDYCSVT